MSTTQTFDQWWASQPLKNGSDAARSGWNARQTEINRYRKALEGIINIHPQNPIWGKVEKLQEIAREALEGE